MAHHYTMSLIMLQTWAAMEQLIANPEAPDSDVILYEKANRRWGQKFEEMPEPVREIVARWIREITQDVTK